MTSQPGEETAVQRPEDDDHDLLTFGEAGARLEIEIRTTRARLHALEDALPRDEAAIGQASARLAELEDGAARNRAQPINDENFEKFFGYPGQARRNTTW
jgi:L-rhamnose isomerase